MEKTITTTLPEQPARPEVTGDLGNVLLRPLRAADAEAFHAMQQLSGVFQQANVGVPCDSLESTRAWQGCGIGLRLLAELIDAAAPPFAQE